MTTSTNRCPSSRHTRTFAVLVTLAFALAGCTVGRAVPSLGPLPPNEQSTVHAGVEQLPPDAKLSINTAKAPSQLDPGKAHAQRLAYVRQTRIALGLLKRYLANPYRKGRFTIAGDTGPGATTLGRAAAAVTSAIATLDTALPNAPAAMRQPTLQLRADLLTLGGSLRRGDTVSPAAFSRLELLTGALVAVGTKNHVKVYAGKAPAVTPVAVSARWRLQVRQEIDQARRLTNSGLGALKRYVVTPALRGRFLPTLSSLSIQRAQHRAQEALAYALAQWAKAADISARLSHLRPLTAALTAARRVLRADALAARRGTLSPAQAANLQAVIDGIARAGRTLHLRLRAGHSPTFAT